jgi:deazaflavin-dependent oxidoreductase (nitroreductase family)
MSDRNKHIIDEFRANEGVVGGHFAGHPLLLLHTIGAKSGKERVNPAAAFEAGERLFIIASKGGAPTHPKWYYNVVANPVVGIEYGTETFQAQATVAQEPERSRLYKKAVSEFPSFGEYEKKANRVIPVIILTRLS